MKHSSFPWIVLILAVLLTTALACAGSVQVPIARVLETQLPDTLAPASVTPAAVPLSGPTPTACPNGDCANACMAKLSAIPQSSGSSEARPKAAGQGPRGLNAVTLVTYPVKGDELGAPKYAADVPADLSALQHDQQVQQKIWQYFAAIIPAEQRTQIHYYIVATDGKGGMLASVEQFSGHSDTWALVMDPLDASRPRDLTLTMLHEFGHLLTLNSSQVQPDQTVLQNPNDLTVYKQEAAACPQYFASGGCSLADSYINQFFDRFWVKIYDDWMKVNAARNDSNYMSLLAHFYRSHPSQFVTPYAATSPEEDMAETWSHFVLNRKPAGDTIADQKVLFFYGFPELVALRNQIISNLCTYAASQ